MQSTGLNSEGYIIQTDKKQASTLKGKYTYYSFSMASNNMNANGGDGTLYTNLFSSKSINSCVASRCVKINSSTAEFYLFYVRDNYVGNCILCGSDSYENWDRYVLRPIITIDLKNVKLEGEGMIDSPYTITKR